MYIITLVALVIIKPNAQNVALLRQIISHYRLAASLWSEVLMISAYTVVHCIHVGHSNCCRHVTIPSNF